MSKRIDRINNFRYPISQPTVFDEEELTILELVSKVAYKINETIGEVNSWFDYLDDFVEVFDENLQGKVTETLTEWQDSGLLDVIIDDALQTQMDVLEDETHAKLEMFETQMDVLEDEIQAKLDDTGVNIKQYKNLVVDDDWTTAIQTAINSFDDVGGTLFFPEGTYKVSSSIIFPSISNDPLVLKPITILGVNGHSAGGNLTSHLRGLTAFHYVGEGALFELRSLTDASTSAVLTFRNFSAYGTNKIGSYGINGYSTVGSIYENVSFQFFDIGILIRNYLYYSIFDNVVCTYNLTYGASLGLINGTTFRNSKFSKNKITGIRVDYSGTVVNFDTCWFEGNKEYGIYSRNTQQLNTFGCYFEDNKIASIYFSSYEDSSIAHLNSISCFHNISKDALCGIRYYKNVNINLYNTTVTSIGDGKRLVDVHSTGNANVYSYGFVSIGNEVTIALSNNLKVDIGNLHKDYEQFGRKSRMNEVIEFGENKGLNFGAGAEDVATTGVLGDFPNISSANGNLLLFRRTNTTGEVGLNIYAANGTNDRTIFFNAGLGMGLFKGGIGVGNSTDGDVTSTPKIKKMQVFNEFGAPLGYVQLYKG